VEIDGWRLPPVDILDTSPEVQFSQADNLKRANLIEETLASYGVEAKVVQINAGPTVTQFGVEPGWDRKFKEVKEKDRDGNVQVRMEEVSKTRVKVERINSLANDLALALAAPTIRIEAPVPGKTFVGVEVPNTTSDLVSLRGVLETSAFQKLLAKTRMALALGKGAGGEAVAADLTKMPHLLIAGATGSGKTVCLNTILCCLLMYNTPNDVRFILIDPKRVELTQYNSLPHLATSVIVDTVKALSALRWLLEEMDQRYKKLAAAGARHIEQYNKDKRGTDKLPYLVLIIDELADLMMAGFDEVESSLCRLAQLSRATGIHLVVATQRPSVDVVTGLIKANFPTRISFAVTSQVDSRTILDGAGAEKLLGRGDMLYMPTEAAKPKRLQGCFLSDTEIDRLVYFWGSQQKEETDKLRMETLVATAPSGMIGGYPRDPLLEQAKELAKQYSDVSTSFLQRKLHIGYPRAARLKDQLDAVLQEEQEREHVNEESLESSGEKGP
jgi:S-DNA-T family DNA segregation ATPase FtsK/SpoIIIE